MLRHDAVHAPQAAGGELGTGATAGARRKMRTSSVSAPPERRAQPIYPGAE